MKQVILKQVACQLSSAVDAVSRMNCLERLGKGIDRPQSRFVEKLLANVLIHDKNPVVRHEAAFTLGELYTKGDIRGTGSIDALCRGALHDHAIVVRHEAVETLGYYPFLQAMRTLKKCMRDPNVEVVATAKISLVRHLARQKPNHRDRRP